MKRIFVAVILSAVPLLLPSMTGDEAVQKFKARMYSISTLEGAITITYSSGMMSSGQFKYMAPGKFYIKFTNPSGKIICSNSRKLWVYDPSTSICGIQEVDPKGLSGGIAGMISGYVGISNQSGSDYTIKLKAPGRGYSEIVIVADKTFMMKKASFKSDQGEGFSVVLSNLRVNENMHAGLFDFNIPSNAQMIKDPLNVK